MPFPPLPWWAVAARGAVELDVHEHYQKRSFRNRFIMVQASGPVSWTIPVERRGGVPRPQDQTRRMAGEGDRKAWQAIRTAYGRAPYFAEMGSELEFLFMEGPEWLGPWNRATLQWAAQWLGIAVPSDAAVRADIPVDHEQGQEGRIADWSGWGHRWSHVWEDRLSDLPHARLGILDALLHLGPEASRLLIPPPGSAQERPG